MGRLDAARRFVGEAPLHMALIGLDGRFIAVSPSAASGPGLTAAEHAGRRVAEACPLAGRAYEAIRAGLDGGAAQQVLLRQVDVEGEPRWLRSEGSYWRGDDGEPAAVLILSQDLTAELVAEREAAMADANAASQAKSQFVAHISHEIRTPLNGVIGMAQAMERGALPPEQRERLEVIRRSGEAVLTLLNDVLDLSKIEAGKLEMEAVEFELEETVRGACAAFQTLAAQKGVAFEIAVHGEAGRRLGDPTRLRQVVSNLAGNALKFTDCGGVVVEVAAGAQSVEITVADSGIGMPQQALARLFDPFAQADATIARRFGGTGLGLAICRELVEMMGGWIRVESAPGEGSRFAFTLPLPRVGPSQPAAARRAIRCVPMRVLAAEDNAVNRLVLRTLLEQVGMEVATVDNGAEAVEAWAAEAWDAILMDVQMPVMDGPSAAAEIRRRERAEGRTPTPIVALTANAMTHQAAEYLAGGMDAVVAKPIDIRALLETLSQVVALGEVAKARSA
ncbi:MAG TPA: ATP-binding protein [Caulobacteraceae bacterium]